MNQGGRKLNEPYDGPELTLKLNEDESVTLSTALQMEEVPSLDGGSWSEMSALEDANKWELVPRCCDSERISPSGRKLLLIRSESPSDVGHPQAICVLGSLMESDPSETT
ncbi:hypothetical protein NDN08_003276 [Rhodosorus marinus]|uniref:Anaphase-promoting complex subunit 1 n=1 Tax=Rhodosorus marinus TaxID=101924 RepID=A0AAV8UWI1_9RHOD|nr:hypothetical protein NDN08_003276 [Rhodosorus marinus]